MSARNGHTNFTSLHILSKMKKKIAAFNILIKNDFVAIHYQHHLELSNIVHKDALGLIKRLHHKVAI